MGTLHLKCGTCKFYAQGKTCSFCENPKQEDEDLKRYSYYPFSCDLWEEGIAESRVRYNKLLKENK